MSRNAICCVSFLTASCKKLWEHTERTTSNECVLCTTRVTKNFWFASPIYRYIISLPLKLYVVQRSDIFPHLSTTSPHTLVPHRWPQSSLWTPRAFWPCRLSRLHAIHPGGICVEILRHFSIGGFVVCLRFPQNCVSQWFYVAPFHQVQSSIVEADVLINTNPPGLDTFSLIPTHPPFGYHPTHPTGGCWGCFSRWSPRLRLESISTGQNFLRPFPINAEAIFAGIWTLAWCFSAAFLLSQARKPLGYRVSPCFPCEWQAQAGPFCVERFELWQLWVCLKRYLEQFQTWTQFDEYKSLYLYISGERVWSPQWFCWLECAQCVYSWTRTLLGGLWNVHTFCDTCTTSVKRAQLLGNVHKISDTCTTSLKRAQHLWNVHI